MGGDILRAFKIVFLGLSADQSRGQLKVVVVMGRSDFSLCRTNSNG